MRRQIELPHQRANTGVIKQEAKMQNLETQIRTKEIQFDMKLEEAILIGHELQQLRQQQEALEQSPHASARPVRKRVRGAPSRARG